MEITRSDTAQIGRMLRAVPYFAGLDEHVLDGLMQRMQLRRIPAGQTIFLKGEGSGEAPFYLVIDGQVRIYLASARGREQVLRVFGPGDTFGEVPLFDGGPYPASADALTDVLLAVVPRAQILGLMAEHPEFAIEAVQVLASRLRHFNTLIEDLSLRRVAGRIARLLLEEPAAKFTQAQIAAMIGASREAVNRSLHTLEDDGLIELGAAGRVTILDRERLAAFVEHV